MKRSDSAEPAKEKNDFAFCHAATEGKKVPTDTTRLLKLRCIYSDMQPMEIKTTHTIAALVLGENSAAENMMFEHGVKKKHGSIVLWALWYIGAITGVLCVAKVLPMYLVWASVLMLPLPFVVLALSCTDLLVEVFSNLDVYIIYILQFALFVDGIYYCGADKRTVFWVCYLPTMLASGIIDCYPAKYRAFFAKFFFSNMIAILLVWNYLLAFRWNAFGSIYHLKMGSLSFLLHHISDQATLAIFYLRHLFCSFFSEDYYVMIKADVLTGHQECEYHQQRDCLMLKHAHRGSEVRIHAHSRASILGERGEPLTPV